MGARLVTNLTRGMELFAISGHSSVMAWVGSVTENGGRLVSRHVGAHSAWKSFSSLLVKKHPVSIRSRILFGAIYGGDQVPQASIVSAVVFVERAFFVFPCSFVQDVDQQCSVLHVCDVTGWNWFINHVGIPVNLQGDCDLHQQKMVRNYSCFGRRIYQGYSLHVSRFTLRASTFRYHLTL